MGKEKNYLIFLIKTLRLVVGILWLFVTPNMASAQLKSITVMGKVLNSKGQRLKFANIEEVGWNNHAYTDSKGNFRIKLQLEANNPVVELKSSFVGMQSLSKKRSYSTTF